jgi:hypothetical protein
MALIERYHTVASVLSVDRDSANDIIEGMCVQLATSGGATVVQRVDGATNTCMGIAADSFDQDGGNHPYSETVVVSGTGGTRSTQNRVSDMFDETVASGQITVYTGAGEFFTDQYDTADTFTPGDALFAEANGLVSVTSAGNQIGRVIAAPTAYPSGVPGADDTPENATTTAINGSTSLGDFLHFQLNIQ